MKNITLFFFLLFLFLNFTDIDQINIFWGTKRNISTPQKYKFPFKPVKDSRVYVLHTSNIYIFLNRCEAKITPSNKKENNLLTCYKLVVSISSLIFFFVIHMRLPSSPRVFIRKTRRTNAIHDPIDDSILYLFSGVDFFFYNIIIKKKKLVLVLKRYKN